MCFLSHGTQKMTVADCVLKARGDKELVTLLKETGAKCLVGRRGEDKAGEKAAARRKRR